jgi:hypothetical protein
MPKVKKRGKKNAEIKSQAKGKEKKGKLTIDENGVIIKSN